MSEIRDHPGSRTRRTGEDLIEWTPIQQHELKYVPLCEQCASGAHVNVAECTPDFLCLHTADRMLVLKLILGIDVHCCLSFILAMLYIYMLYIRLLCMQPNWQY